MGGRIVTVKEGPIGFLVFDQPERKNAVSAAMWRGIPGAVQELAEDPDVRVVVLRGKGDEAFVSGADISEFQGREGGPGASGYDVDTAQAFLALAHCDKPVMAMIHGPCIGGGLALALTADFRYAADDAIFAIPAARLGVGYPLLGIDSLVQVVGPATAKEIFFTARRFSAQEAFDRGLINAVRPKSELEAFVHETATRIGENAPLTMKSVKLAVRELGKAPDARDYAAVDASILACFSSEDYLEGVRAFLEKRKPEFRGK